MNAEESKKVVSAVRTVRRYLKTKDVSKETFMEACFVVAMGLIGRGIRPLYSPTRRTLKNKEMRERWGWDTCFGFSGGTTHVFNRKTRAMIWPGHFTLKDAYQFASDMQKGGFLKQLMKLGLRK